MVKAGVHITVLMVAAAVGCKSAPSRQAAVDAQADAPTSDAVEVGPDDVAPDGADPREAADAADAACNSCWYGHCIDRAVCLTATALEPGVPLTGQNTGSGGYGDCAASGSSGGDPQLYYSLQVPPQGQFAAFVRVVAAPDDTQEAAYVRVLSDCDAVQIETGARGGASTNGAAGVCVSNTTSSPRTVIVAVGNYSNAVGGLAFTLSAEVIAPGFGCTP